MKKKFLKYVLEFTKSFTMVLTAYIIVGKLFGFTPFYIIPLSWAELFEGNLSALIILGSIFGVMAVYFQWEKDNKK